MREWIQPCLVELTHIVVRSICANVLNKLQPLQVISSMDPLRVLLFREGLVLRAASNFSTDPATFDDLTVHLTNAAVRRLCVCVCVENRLWSIVLSVCAASVKAAKGRA